MGFKGLPWMGDRRQQALVERVQSDSRSGSIISRTIDAATRAVATESLRPFEGGKLVRSVVINSTSQRLIHHGLGRRPSGWILTRVIGTGALDAPIRELAVAPYVSTAEHIYLRNDASNGVTIDVWFF